MEKRAQGVRSFLWGGTRRKKMARGRTPKGISKNKIIKKNDGCLKKKRIKRSLGSKPFSSCSSLHSGVMATTVSKGPNKMIRNTWLWILPKERKKRGRKGAASRRRRSPPGVSGTVAACNVVTHRKAVRCTPTTHTIAQGRGGEAAVSLSSLWWMLQNLGAFRSIVCCICIDLTRLTAFLLQQCYIRVSLYRLYII